jgi:hypothetical protein
MLVLTMSTELQVAENVSTLLRAHGEVSLIYITANFEPFSSQGRPDIVFVPREAPTHCFCVELRFGRRRALQPAAISALAEHLSFVRSTVEFPSVEFAFATDEHLEPTIATLLLEQKVRPFSGVTDAADLADRMIRWAKLVLK